MKLTFLGAAHEVTGSCFLLEACGKKILIDCGMEQGKDIFVNQSIPCTASLIDFVLLTHAHIDHSGKLPMLLSQGFAGKIFSTQATHKLCEIMLKDSAHIQEFEAQWHSRKAKRSGAEPYVALYTVEDAEKTLDLFVPCMYEKPFALTDGIEVRFIDSGHLLGSASVELAISENGVSKIIVFSGDIGNLNQPIIKDPIYPKSADYVIMESTYGDRSHGERPDYIKNLAEIIQETFDRGGNVVIPSFAVGRTQEMLYFLRAIKTSGLVKGHDGFPVFVDSPLAIEATKVFDDSSLECFDDETVALIKSGINPLTFDGLCLTLTSEDSKLINQDNRPKVILSASGMCEAGRIRHHLKHNLWRKESTILFVGYQAEGTIGRLLLEGASSVKLFGESIKVAAQIRQLAAISGHADCNGLSEWIGRFEKKPAHVFVVHGDEQVCEIFTRKLKDELSLNATAPYSGDAWDLASDSQVESSARERISKPHANAEPQPYQKLLSAVRSLSDIAAKCAHMASSELSRFTEEIERLCERWKQR
ncbi:MAG: MBL fold metallo-hydrolase [Oscillospiraceae bacterium]